tara:strand:+ start:2742 stop:4217 length:1476 start_codon:yes stop_codon:yes gene_type:complete
MSYITIDSSTSSTTVLVFDDELVIKSKFQKEHKQIYTNEGFVEHDLEEIFQNLLNLIREASVIAPNPRFISLTNQRETFALFEKNTGNPVHNAVVWQCTRGKKFCDEISKNEDISNIILDKTGLKISSFFSASKLMWVVENYPEIKSKLRNGEILFGTIDTYLIYRLTNLKFYITDTTNASRTLLFNCEKNVWDDELLSLFNVSGLSLPEIKNSADNFGESNFDNIFNKEIPICGVAGDAQASFFANKCFNKGDTKITTGTGFNIQTNIGNDFIKDSNFFTSLAFTNQHQNTYALECLSSFAGATISWLKNDLKIINSPNESEIISKSLDNNGGVYLIPAFTGLGPPYWQPDAKAAFYGISASTNKNHLVRAALESVAYQMVVYLEYLGNKKNIKPKKLSIDGGMVKNNFFVQIIADLLNIEINIPEVEEMSSYGSLLFGMQKSNSINNLVDLDKFGVRGKKILPKKNQIISDSYNAWKDIIDKHFHKNQH